MWLGLQTVSSLERCPVFHSALYREVPLYTTSDNLTIYQWIIIDVHTFPHLGHNANTVAARRVLCTFESVHSWQCSPPKPDSRSHLHFPHTQVPWPEQGVWEGRRRDWRKGSGGEKRKGKGVKRGEERRVETRERKEFGGRGGKEGEETKEEGSGEDGK